MSGPQMVLGLVLLAAGVALPAQAARYAAGGYIDGVAGPNGVRDVSPAACDPTVGCFTNTGARCADAPDVSCDVQVTPRGRCSHGAGTCVWPQSAGFCAGAGADPVACLTDAYLDFLANGGPNPGNASGPSLMCAEARGSNGVCDMSSNDPSCDCTGTDPTADLSNTDPDVPSWEGTVCGPGEVYAACSDGDPFRLEVGPGVGSCLDAVGGSFEGNCLNHTAPGVLGVRYGATENPPDRFSPQRRPGSGHSAADPGGPLRGPVRTAPWEVDEAGSGDFQAAGVRRLRRFANGVLWDEVFQAQEVTFGVDLTGPTPHACEIPDFGWSPELPISGSCTFDPAVFCIQDFDCSGAPGDICDPASFVYCHESDDDPHTLADSAFDATGFLYTRALEPGEQTGRCPPDCRSAYDLDTFETEALEQASRSGDPRIGIQAFLDGLEGVRVAEGDVIVPLRHVGSFAFQGDVRCYIGGDPGRPDPSDGRIGRCQTTPEPCDPTLQVGSNGCPTADSCLFCGGTSSVAPHSTNTGIYVFGGNAGFDPVRGNTEALPVGFDTHGMASLDPRGRIGRLNGHPADALHPLVYLLVPGPVRASFKDNSCSGSDSCALGEVAGGGPGIGPADAYFDAGDPVPHEPGGPTYLANVTVPAADPGDPNTPLLSTDDVGAGPDGIPGCMGDTDTFDDTACDETLGLAPGNTGADDVAILHDFSSLGNGSDMRTGTRHDLPSDALAIAPVWTGSAAQSVRDVFPGGLDIDQIQKAQLTFCPVESRDPVTGEFTFACLASDLDGDGFPDELDGCPLNPAQALGPDSGGVGSGADPGGLLPDGILDECQCGDVSDNGRVTGTDAAFIVRACLDMPPFDDTVNCSQSQDAPLPFRHDKCDVGAGADGFCNGNDATLVRFASLGLPPGLDLTCPAYLPTAPP